MFKCIQFRGTCRAYGTALHIFQHKAPAALQLPSWRTILHPHMSSLSQTHLRKHSMTRKHALTRAHLGTVSHTHTLAIHCVFTEMQENTQANLCTHPRGAHTHGDGCIYKLTCTHVVMSKHKPAACACTHTELLACTGTFTSTHPTLLTPTHVFPWVGVGTGVPCVPPFSQHRCSQARREFPAAKLQLTNSEIPSPVIAGPS